MAYKVIRFENLYELLDWTAPITVRNSTTGIEKHFQYAAEAIGPDGLTDEDLVAEVISIMPLKGDGLRIHIAKL